ncbi:hypothetical protein ACIRYZ_24630 [Kitasatospora sp. NPDC101155]|uniref:hypothetical protein n=1 Tax=Kitasatospora sp. NPDC101155 TaxID=3364097 RepID=UPI0038076477
MKIDSLRRHAAISTVAGLLLTILVSCTTSTSTHAGRAASVTVPQSAVRAPFSDEVAAGLQRIRGATDTPPADLWAYYRDQGGQIWFFWPLPDGRSCTGREFNLPDDSDVRQVVCNGNPLPEGSTPAVWVFDGPAIVAGGHWVSFLYADQEEVLDLACGDQHLAAERVASFPTPYGRRAVYAVGTPWSVLGSLRAKVHRVDGSSADATVEFTQPGGAMVSYEHLCA